MFLFIHSCVSGCFQVSVLDHVRCLIVGQLCHYHEHSWRKTIIKEHRTPVFLFMHISLLEEFELLVVIVSWQFPPILSDFWYIFHWALKPLESNCTQERECLKQ